MPIYINTNIASLNSQRHLLGATGELNKVFARLSSGMRINTAGDDAAGLAISNRMTAQVRGLTQAIRNANDGISVSQVAEGALSEHSNMLQRMNELAVQAANATNSDADRLSLQQEINQLLGEIERVAQETEFNNWPMLNGKTQPLVFHVGAREDQTVTVGLADARANTLLAQPHLVNPNAKESVFNPKIKGIVTKIPSPPLANTKLYSANVATGINAIANANEAGASPFTTKPTDVITKVVDAFEGNISAKEAAEASVTGAAVNGTTYEGASFAKSLALAATGSTVKSDVYDAITTYLGLGAVTDLDNVPVGLTPPKTGTSLDGTETVENVATALKNIKGDNTSAFYEKAKVAAAAMIAISRDGASCLDARDSAAAQVIRNADTSLDFDKAQVIAAAAYKAAESSKRSDIVTAIKAGSTTVSTTTLTDMNGTDVVTVGVNNTNVNVNDRLAVANTITKGINRGDSAEVVALAAVRSDAGSNLTLDEARVIVAAAKNFKNGGTATSAGTAAEAAVTKDGVAYAMSSSVSASTAVVVENAVYASGVKDVPVGNIRLVINAFGAAISQGKDIETVAAEARAVDAGGNLSIDIAKVIAAGGKAAAVPGATVSAANTAASNMARVLDARDYTVSYAAKFGAKAIANQHVTVPEWLVDTSGQTKFPPVPLVDITGASVPTDPTLPFDPPSTDGTNPPLNGAKAAGQMLAIIATRLDRVSATRAELGAIESRFAANVKNLSNVVENVSAARSRIMDTDIAAETANLTRLAIMQQAGTAILAQANQQPQLALQLLK